MLNVIFAFLKDCKSPKPDLARDMGPIFLLPHGLTLSAVPLASLSEMRAEDARSKDEMAAADVCKALIEECDALFGDSVSL